MATSTTTRYDNITCKHLIHPGSPDVYQLIPKKEMIGTITRMTLGERDPTKVHKTILLVGETGTGKSTLINALVNYAMGVTWNDDVWFEIVEKEERDQFESQTSDMIVYDLFGFEDKTLSYSLTIIDTPGYGHTRGIEYDDEITKRIVDLFGSEDGVYEINVVGLVLNASDNRLSYRFRYILDSVTSLFGKNMENNIVCLITYSNGSTPENVLKALEEANIKCAKGAENQPVHFLFNNLQNKERTNTKNKRALKHAYDVSMEGMSEFGIFLLKTPPQQLGTTVAVLNERIRLNASFQNLQDQVQLIELKQREIQQTQEALKTNEQEMKSNENFTAEVDEVYKDKEPISGGMRLLFYSGAVCCTVCEENCHYPGCSMVWYPKRCEVMSKGRCTVCTGKCPVSDHVKEKWRYVQKTRKRQITLQDVKEKYDQSKADRKEKTSLLETLQKTMDKLKEDKERLLEESYEHVLRLEQIALNVDSLSTLVHLDFLIKKMKENGDTEKVQKLEEMKSRVKGSTAALRYKFGNLAEAAGRMFQSTTTRYDNITCKHLIHPGSPNVYQLTPKNEKIGTITRMTLGERDPTKVHKTILLVGETGTGKSTLINALVNYAMGVTWNDNVWFEIVEKEERGQTESQTSDVIVYELFGFEDKTLSCSLTIIDTPGYGDTRGIEHDDIITKRIVDLFGSEDGVSEINVVGLVLKASENRLSDRFRYVLDSVASLFGKNMEKNIVCLITYSDGNTPENVLKSLEVANIKCAKDEEKQPVHFLFNNIQNKERTNTKNKRTLKHAYEVSMEGMTEFGKFLLKTPPQQLGTTVDVLNERIRLKASIQNLQERVQLIELKQREIQQTHEALKTHEQEMKSNKNVTVEVDEVYKVKEDISSGMRLLVFYEGAVCCTVCEENCHYPGCSMAWYPEHCEVMSKGRCTVCTGKCPVSDHVKEKWRYVLKTRKRQKTHQDVKEKYDQSKADREEKTSLLETLQKTMDKLKKDKDRWLEESYEHVLRLEQIALNVDSLSTLVHLDFLIEKMKENRDTEKVQKLNEMKSRVKGSTAALRYQFTKLAEAAGRMFQSTTTRYDNITCKHLIHPGSPDVYQLTPKNEKIGTITRLTLGERDPTKVHKTILLVGETGTGKSTLIHALVNYAMGVTWNDNVWFEIIEKEERGQFESQTSDVIVYDLFGFEDKTLSCSLTIIDTPGYGDTRGIEHDDDITTRLVDLFGSEDGVSEINVVGLVLKASENRLSDRFRYVLDSVTSLFGKNMENNIVCLITHSDGITPEHLLKALEEANIKCAKDEENQPVHFLFDNLQNKERTNTKNKRALKHAYDGSMKGMSEFGEFLLKTPSQQLRTTVAVLNERIRLNASIQNLKERVELIELKQREIQQTQEALKTHEQEMKSNKNFTVEVDEVYKVKEPISGGMRLLVFYKGAVCCTVCEENCHYPGCSMAWYPKDCEVISKGRCTVCTGKCPASDHVKEKWRYVQKTRKRQITHQDVKEKYDQSKADREEKTSLLETLQKTMDKLKEDKDRWLKESYEHVLRLEQIALNVDSLSTLFQLDFLIEKMKENGDAEKVKKLEEMKSRVKGTKTALRYKFGKLAEAAGRMFQNTTTRYDNITCKHLIHPGSPDVYQLTPKKEKIGTITRMTLGERDPTKVHKTILLVGETGTGKSTLINALVNYAMGVTWNDNVWFEIVEKEERGQFESQTSDMIVYDLFGFEDKTLSCSLTIIDTPGYGDSRGIEHDDDITNRLSDLFCSEDGVYEINVVGLVLKASEKRLSDRFRYILDSVTSLFGKNMENNIVCLITHSNGMTPKHLLIAFEVANIKCAKDAKKQPVHFLFDNLQNKERTEESKQILKHAYDVSMKGMSEFGEFLQNTAPQHLGTTVAVVNERIILKASIQNLQERVELIEFKQREIQQTQEALKTREQEMKSNKNFTVEVDEVYKDKEPISGGMRLLFYSGAVCCTVCEENCHYPGCWMAWYPEHCEVMSKGRCTVCTGKCPASDHVKEKWRYVQKTRKRQITLQDVKEKYDQSKADCEEKTSLLETLQKTMDKLKEDKDRWLKESYKHVLRLEQIALNVDSLSTLAHLDFLIKKMKENGDAEKVQKLEELEDRVKGSTAALRYKFGKLAVAAGGDEK